MSFENFFKFFLKKDLQKENQQFIIILSESYQ